MTDFHVCKDCVWCMFDNDEVLCINPLFDEYDIGTKQSKCKYFIDVDDLKEMYAELGIYDD